MPTILDLVCFKFNCAQNMSVADLVSQLSGGLLIVMMLVCTSSMPSDERLNVSLEDPAMGSDHDILH